jgi:Flp pilus assembly pilin Flp
MSRLPTNRSGENFIEFALIIILLAIVMLSILLIVGDSIRVFLNDIGIRWSLFNNNPEAMLPVLRQWFT